MPAYASALATADSQLHTDLASAITKLTSILSSVDGLEGYTDQLEGLLTTLNGVLSPPLLVEVDTGVITAQTPFVTNDARNDLVETMTLLRESDGKTRTVTITRDTTTGFPTGIARTPWA